MILASLIAKEIDPGGNVGFRAGDIPVRILPQISGADSPVKFFTVDTLVGQLASYALIIGALAVLGYLVFGGFLWTMAGGDKEQLEKAKRMITQSLIGLLILACSFALFSVIQYIVGVDILK